MIMKKLILILAIAFSVGSLFAQTYKTQFDVRGVMTGSSSVTLDVASAVVLTADSCHNHIRYNDDADAIDYTLPLAEAGLAIVIYDAKGGAITIDPYDGVDNIYLEGVASGAGDEILSLGVIDDMVWLVAVDDTRWYVMAQRGTWGVP